MHVQTVENMVPILEANAPTRASLLQRVREWSDDASWQEFFELYWKLIYSLATQAGLNDSEAEEVVQTTMISISKRIKTFKYDRETGTFRQWICRQAWWKINDQLRRRQRDQARFGGKPEPSKATHTGTATVARIPDRRDSFEIFVEEDWHEAIQRLALARVRAAVKPKHFQIFDLYVVKKWPIREVARLLQVNPAQIYLVKSRISRLLKKTRKNVEAQLERLPPAVQKSNAL
jgi:RNA polymerase sigma-70 factor (ECF subfamily)